MQDGFAVNNSRKWSFEINFIYLRRSELLPWDNVKASDLKYIFSVKLF